ncbi:MAG TPA: pyridoxal phosphate-dependent aminotransferase [Polyangiales bacterium]
MPRYPRFSQVADGLSSQIYTSLLGLARESGRELFPLNVGDTHLEPADSASVSALSAARFPGMHRYAEVRGEPALLDAICHDLARRGRPVARELLQVTPGGTSGLDLACRCVIKPGDEVILLAPYWPLIRGILSACGAVVRELPLFTRLREPGFDLRAALESVVTPKTTAIYVNSPNNPTGVVLDQPEIDLLASFARDHALWVLSDEAYERLHHDDEPSPAVWLHPELRERALVMHTLSKSYGISGARVAYLHGPPEVMAALSGLSTFTNYCAARPMQLAAARVLSAPDGEAWVENARAAYRAAAARTAEVLRIPRPESGTFAFFDTRPYRRDGETAHQLLERIARAGVVLTPGLATGRDFTDYARLCFTAVPPPTLERALAALAGVLYS